MRQLSSHMNSGELLKQPDLTAYIETPSPASTELSKVFSSKASLTIFDIGSCEGEDTIRYARQFPFARLFAFEPLPANIELIRLNLNAFNTSNVEIVPCALSDQAGTAEFHVSSGRPQHLF